LKWKYNKSVRGLPLSSLAGCERGKIASNLVVIIAFILLKFSLFAQSQSPNIYQHLKKKNVIDNIRKFEKDIVNSSNLNFEDSCSNGLYIVYRRIPLISISYDKKDTIIWKDLYNDGYLGEYKIIFRDEFNPSWFINGNDSFEVHFPMISAEEIAKGGANGYFDSIGNYYSKVFFNNKYYLSHGNYAMIRYGLVNAKGKIVQPLIFDEIEYKQVRWHNEQACFRVVLKSKIGMMNAKGVLTIKPMYDFVPDSCLHGESDRNEIYKYINGCCKVFKNGFFGIIDKDGKEILPCIFNSIYYDYDYGNRKGKEVFKCFRTEIIKNNNCICRLYDRYGKLLN